MTRTHFWACWSTSQRVRPRHLCRRLLSKTWAQRSVSSGNSCSALSALHQSFLPGHYARRRCAYRGLRRSRTMRTCAICIFPVSMRIERAGCALRHLVKLTLWRLTHPQTRCMRRCAMRSATHATHPKWSRTCSTSPSCKRPSSRFQRCVVATKCERLLSVSSVSPHRPCTQSAESEASRDVDV